MYSRLFESGVVEGPGEGKGGGGGWRERAAQICSRYQSIVHFSLRSFGKSLELCLLICFLFTGEGTFVWRWSRTTTSHTLY